MNECPCPLSIQDAGHAGPSLFISVPRPPAQNEYIFLSALRMAELGHGQAEWRTGLGTALGFLRVSERVPFSGLWKFVSFPHPPPPPTPKLSIGHLTSTTGPPPLSTHSTLHGHLAKNTWSGAPSFPLAAGLLPPRDWLGLGLSSPFRSLAVVQPAAA